MKQLLTAFDIEVENKTKAHSDDANVYMDFFMDLTSPASKPNFH